MDMTWNRDCEVLCHHRPVFLFNSEAFPVIIKYPTYHLVFRKISKVRKDLLTVKPPYEVMPWECGPGVREWAVAQNVGWSLDLIERKNWETHGHRIIRQQRIFSS